MNISAQKKIINPTSNQKPNKLETLVNLETEALAVPDHITLRHIIANKPRQIISYGLGVCIELSAINRGTKTQWITKTISNQGVVERTSPFVQFIEQQVVTAIKTHTEGDEQKSFQFNLIDESTSGKITSISIPYPHALFIPITSEVAVIYLNPEPWLENDITILQRLCALYGCVWKALAVPTTSKWRKALSQRGLLIGTLIALIILCWPVSMTTLAPAEIKAKDAQIVSAPINGVIDYVHVSPNSFIKKGDKLVTYIDTAKRNEFMLAQEEVTVAEARLKKIMLSSFLSPESKRDIQVAQSELALAKSQRDYALENLNQITLVAETDGLLLYTDQDEWSGRPVSVGERIMEIANPANVELHIEAPTSDGKLLQKDARVRLCLDAAPLKPINASLTTSSYTPEPTPNGNLAYMTRAKLTDTQSNIPRIGARGVAKIFGQKVPFGFWLLRKPIVATRQFLGM